jgi:hypothetical protein
MCRRSVAFRYWQAHNFSPGQAQKKPNLTRSSSCLNEIFTNAAGGAELSGGGWQTPAVRGTLESRYSARKPVKTASRRRILNEMAISRFNDDPHPLREPPPPAEQTAMVTLVCVSVGVGWTAACVWLGAPGMIAGFGLVFAVLSVLGGTVGVAQARDFARHVERAQQRETAAESWYDEDDDGEPRTGRSAAS